jgi:hypothetical protein
MLLNGKIFFRIRIIYSGFGHTGKKKTDLSDVFSAESAAELSCFHHHDGVMVEPLDDVLMNNVLILPLRMKKKNLTRSHSE